MRRRELFGIKPNTPPPDWRHEMDDRKGEEKEIRKKDFFGALLFGRRRDRNLAVDYWKRIW